MDDSIYLQYKGRKTTKVLETKQYNIDLIIAPSMGSPGI